MKVGSQESPVSPGGETAASEKDVMPTILQVKLEDANEIAIEGQADAAVVERWLVCAQGYH